MDNSLVYKILIVFLLQTSFLAQLSAETRGLFEGSVTFKVRTPQGINEMKQYIKERKLRVEVRSAGKALSVGIADYAKKLMYLIYPQKGAYTEISISPAAISKEASRALASSKISQTGNYAEILGYQCSEWRYQNDQFSTEIWVAQDFGNFLEALEFGERDRLIEWRKEIMGAGGFPLRIIEYDLNGKERSRMDAIAVDRGSLSDEIFNLPEGLKNLSKKG